jgi:hypothetical protein
MEYWSVGVLEYWKTAAVLKVKTSCSLIMEDEFPLVLMGLTASPITPTLQYSITPIFHYSSRGWQKHPRTALS